MENDEVAECDPPWPSSRSAVPHRFPKYDPGVALLVEVETVGETVVYGCRRARSSQASMFRRMEVAVASTADPRHSAQTQGFSLFQWLGQATCEALAISAMLSVDSRSNGFDALS